MEDTQKRLHAILAQAEESLRRVIIDAAEAGDYKSIDAARRMAGDIRNILDSFQSRPSQASPSEDMSEAELPPSGARAARDKSKPKRRDYPKFLVSKDTLHKISWSKSEKKEYTHKIGKEAYGFTLAAIHALAQWGPSPFTVDQIVEKAEKKAGQPVPVYQVYVAVAFLRQHGVIRRVGREGYVAVAENQAAGSRLWDELAEEASPA